MTRQEEIRQLQNILNSSDNIVFFGGAGLSTESGIPDFRSTDGLYHQQYRYPPEVILSHSFYEQQPQEFFRFYREKMLALDAKPNPAHYKLAELEQAGRLKAVVTQNIDGLHQAAGSRVVWELHGSVHRNHCQRCGHQVDAWFIQNSTGVPTCPKCGGPVKPDVVLYEESLDGYVMQQAMEAIARADVLVIGGTSLVVYPAAGMVEYFRGSRLVLINRDIDVYRRRVDLAIQGSIGEVLGQVEVRALI
ncbi:MAG: NAD-dependent protein deacylase [Eubacteriales bacterium]|jgi:NAD-dependent deacetylase